MNMNIDALVQIEMDYIKVQLEKMEKGELKKGSVETYSSRALNGKDKDINKYITYQVLKALYKYRKQNGGDAF